MSSHTLTDLLPKLVCPECHGSLRFEIETLTCTSCGLSFAVKDGVPILLRPASAASIGGFRLEAENVRIRTTLGRVPALLKLADLLRAPHPFWYMRRKASHAQRVAFSELVAGNDDGRPNPIFLDIGSGILGGSNASGLTSHIRDHVVALEIAPTAGVGVVGDAHYLPFADASVDGVLIQGVLEHVQDPERIVAEIKRVMRPGAPVFSEVPFMQHYHLDPVDFRRWTHYGFAMLFRDFAEVSSGVCAGPAAALTDMLTEFPALLFSRPTFYWGVKVVTGWLFAPLQLLDVIWARTSRAHIMAGAVYFLGRKPPTSSQSEI